MPKDAMDYLEENRLKGLAVTGKELRGKFSQKEIDAGLTRQRKKLKPNSPEDDIMESQSKMRRMFSKDYK